MGKWERPTRTAIQFLIVLIPAVPFLVPALGLSATAGLGASLVAGASLLSRLMATDLGESILSRLGLSPQSQKDE